MSILIKGMDMPKEGEHIVTLIKSNGKCTYWKQDTEYGICEPMQTVEAIQILTPHGRLMDKDELLSHLKKDPLFNLVERYGISGVIESRPTILEAEE